MKQYYRYEIFKLFKMESKKWEAENCRCSALWPGWEAWELLKMLLVEDEEEGRKDG